MPPAAALLDKIRSPRARSFVHVPAKIIDVRHGGLSGATKAAGTELEFFVGLAMRFAPLGRVGTRRRRPREHDQDTKQGHEQVTRRTAQVED